MAQTWWANIVTNNHTDQIYSLSKKTCYVQRITGPFLSDYPNMYWRSFCGLRFSMPLKGMKTIAKAFFWKDTRTNYYMKGCADQQASDPESCSAHLWIC